MNIKQLRPNLLAITPYTATASQTAANKIAVSYRLLCVKKGSLTLQTDRQSFRLTENDILFLSPNTLYTTAFDAGMSVVNVFFNLSPKMQEQETDPQYFETSYFEKKKYDKIEIEEIKEWNTFCKYSSVETMKQIEKIENLCAEKEFGYRLAANGILSYVLYLLIKQSNTQKKETHIALSDIENYIDSHIDEPITCEMLASHFFYHPNYLNKLTQKLCSVPLHRFILQRKIEFGKTLLLRNQLTVTEIAHLLCFFDASHFTRTFTALTGKTPLQFKKEEQKRFEETKIQP